MAVCKKISSFCSGLGIFLFITFFVSNKSYSQDTLLCVYGEYSTDSTLLGGHATDLIIKTGIALVDGTDTTFVKYPFDEISRETGINYVIGSENNYFSIEVDSSVYSFTAEIRDTIMSCVNQIGDYLSDHIWFNIDSIPAGFADGIDDVDDLDADPNNELDTTTITQLANDSVRWSGDGMDASTDIKWVIQGGYYIPGAGGGGTVEIDCAEIAPGTAAVFTSPILLKSTSRIWVNGVMSREVINPIHSGEVNFSGQTITRNEVLGSSDYCLLCTW